ncbi:TonB-dependent receptor [Reichenbachiella sp. 5M10]|uniref:TonB-dependent receptor n=1 Tax=Reichenbachiella sp. 5M10 TaxID=1889772 RepID=UPI000C147952|nr:TonB-dependent receptor [Reichenbachiella sp. 5M10]PIB34614.1 TonB-dependent receptor [Reichenbachiella sp. 5M10]
MKKTFLLLLCLTSMTAWAQTGAISGQVIDEESGEALIGATVTIQGTSTGAVADVAGEFTLEGLDYGSYTVLFNFVGYAEKKQTVELNNSVLRLEPVALNSSSIGLEEVMVLASVAVDRQTPVAVSTVKAAQIESKIGSQEFPEILKATPGVYATRAGGGFGDGRVNVRGFSDENVAVLINGVPVNDMENGRVYWSNWAGIMDIAQNVQVQRGLGASKIAVPSIGGTINVVSKASDREQGGSLYMATGNNAYSKLGLTLSTGLTDKNWAVTLSGSRTQGDGFVKGTEFLGYSYFLNVAKKINKKHELVFTAVGALQRHGQRQNMQSLSTFDASPDGIRYNADWGYKNGQVVHVEDNFYHKPQLSLNHYWTINQDTELATSVYASFGSGGGGGTGGPDFVKNRVGGTYGPIDLDYLVDRNEATVDGNALAFLRASRNDHKWYGILSTLTKDLGNGFSVMGGVDGRFYQGKHYQEVTDLLGADYYIDGSDENNPNKVVKTGDKFSYYNDGLVGWGGVFGQVEYKKEKLSAFVTVNASNTSYKRIDYYNYLDSDPEQETDWISFFAYGVKGGANYNLTDNHGVYFNVGYFQRAPFFDGVFLNFQNDINEDAVNQKVISYEVGYNFRSSKFNANLNAYRTQWKDRTYTATSNQPDGTVIFGNLLGVDALHQGVELDAVFEPYAGLRFTGMISIGDWRWQNDLENVNLYDEEQNLIETVNIFIKDVHVSDAAQTTAALGVQYELLKGLRFGVDYNYAARYYAQFDPTSRESKDSDGNNIDSWEIPAFGLVDLNLTYDFEIAGFNSSLYGNVYNVANTKYVSDANDGSNHDAASSSVYYGAGTTWNLGLKMRF